MSSFVIRAVRREEVDYLVSMGKRLHEISLFKDMEYDEDKVAHIAHAAVDGAPNLFFYCIEDSLDEVPIGFLLAYITESFFGKDKIASDMTLLVEPERRGECKDALRALTAVYRRWATAHGAKRIYLATSTGIEPARTEAAYEYCGFHRIGTIHESVGE